MQTCAKSVVLKNLNDGFLRIFSSASILIILNTHKKNKTFKLFLKVLLDKKVLIEYVCEGARYSF